MVFAAGVGSRLRPFSETIPKPFLPVLGIPTIQYQLDLLNEVAIQTAVINIHHLPQIAKREIGNLDWGGVESRISDESSELLAGAGGLKKALPQFSGPVLICNSDVISAVDLRAFCERHSQLKRDQKIKLTLAIHAPIGPSMPYREVFLDHKTGLIEKLGSLRPQCPFYSGMGIIELDLLEPLPENQPLDFVKAILQPAIQRKEAAFFLDHSLWLDIGSPALWWRAHFKLLKNHFEKQLPRSWQKRLMQKNDFFSSSASSKGTTVNKSPLWVDPVYVNGSDFAETVIGPHTVLYGAPSDYSGKKLTCGLGYQGIWQSFQN